MATKRKIKITVPGYKPAKLSVDQAVRNFARATCVDLLVDARSHAQAIVKELRSTSPSLEFIEEAALCLMESLSQRRGIANFAADLSDLGLLKVDTKGTP